MNNKGHVAPVAEGWGALSNLPGHTMMWVLIMCEVVTFGLLILAFVVARIVGRGGLRHREPRRETAVRPARHLSPPPPLKVSAMLARAAKTPSRSMRYPDFYDEVPRILLHDPLCDFLGSTEGGILEFGYLDAVKLAGHSCPTVAGAYIMTVRALDALYPGRMPVRGDIDVLVREEAEDGVAGVVANVAALITGAAGSGGFKGIGGHYERRDRMHFGVDISCTLAFRRRDTGAVIGATLNAGVLPVSPADRDLMQQVLTGRASSDDEAMFRWHWQHRVKRMLVEHFDDPELVACTLGAIRKRM